MTTSITKLRVIAIVLAAILSVLCTLNEVSAQNRGRSKPTPEEETKAQAVAEMRAAHQRFLDLRSRLEVLVKEIGSPDRRRSIEELRKEHKALIKQIEDEQRRIQEAERRHDQAVLSAVERHDQAARRAEDRRRAAFFGPAADVAEEIVVAVFGWYEDMQVAADAYRKNRPRVRFKFLVYQSRKIEKFCRGQVDLLAHLNRYSDYLGGDEQRLFRETFPNPPAETTIAYRSLAAIVHPKNPLAKLGREQLQLLATERNRTWRDLGRAEDGPVWVYVFETHNAERAITGKSDVRWILKSYWPSVRMTEDNVLEALTEDRNGIALWYHDKRFAASGLKVVPLVLEDGSGVVYPTDVSAVASGRYWMRTPLRIMVHPDASEEVRRFARWLTTPEAGKAMLKAHRRSSLPATYPSPIAPVSLAVADAPATEPEATPAAQSQPAAPAVQVHGAVAILPTEPLSMYFLMAEASHHALYEQTIFDAIEADGRLDLVDRTQLERILEEQKLGLLNPQRGPARPVIAADVFILSYVVTRDNQTYLRIQAVHGATACLLGQLELRIDPVDPARFSPPLSQSVARWWSCVLQRLDAVRNRPIWALGDVYAGSVEALDQAAQVRQALEGRLSANPRIFFARRIPLSWTQQEVLMRLMGFSRPNSGRFSPATDYLVEARLPAPGRLQIRLLSAGMVRLADTELVEEDIEELARRAATWLGCQVADCLDRRPPDNDAASTPCNDWAREQARFEMKLGKQLSVEAYRLEREADLRYCEGGTVKIPLDEAQRIQRIRRQAHDHFQRAAQLDPTWEQAALALAPPDGEAVRSIHSGRATALITSKEGLDAQQYFMLRFPKSKHYEAVLYSYARWSLAVGKAATDGRLPVGIDRQSLAQRYFRQGIDAYLDFNERYVLTGSISVPYMPGEYRYQHYGHLLWWIDRYFELAHPSADIQQRLVCEWSTRFDAHTKQAPHSDFVRLIVLSHKKDRAGFLKLLRAMQKRWPDPRRLPWSSQTSDGPCVFVAGEVVRKCLERLYWGTDKKYSDVFRRWVRGEVAAKELPWMSSDITP